MYADPALTELMDCLDKRRVELGFLCSLCWKARCCRLLACRLVCKYSRSSPTHFGPHFHVVIWDLAAGAIAD